MTSLLVCVKEFNKLTGQTRSAKTSSLGQSYLKPYINGRKYSIDNYLYNYTSQISQFCRQYSCSPGFLFNIAFISLL